MLSEIFGVNALMRETACTWATDGYHVLVPDLFWRQAQQAELQYEGPDRERAFALYEGFDHDAGANDVLDAVDYARTLPEGDGHVFVVGYCLGGTLAWLAAARGAPDAVAALYGTKVHHYLGEAGEITCPTALHFGDADPFVGRDDQELIAGAVAKRPAISLHRYAGAAHAFMNRLRPAYERDAAQTARSQILEMFGNVAQR